MSASTTRIATIIVVVSATAAMGADSKKSATHAPRVPDGFSIELVAGPPLVERPIVAAFDDDGRLYVAESSGSNDPVEQQLAELPHRIVRLDDVDGDGRFDRRIVFADRMMFPAGTLFLDGSLYVAAPPSIWKLTDTDGDGTADERIEWFQGKTLTGCANDLHGPYLGPDGWLYWCKGAFAEQTYKLRGREWKTRAAHIFRCRLDGTGIEPVMTGGMDNPVDVVFTADGERIFSATFLEGNPRNDGLVHAIYGGVYGKEHGVLERHPRTGELMPLLARMSAAAPSGLERYEALAFGPEYADNLFLCQFNMRKVSRHVLRPAGSTYTNEASDFVTSDHVDFHPTDVLVDADGSLLVIDTGGWYKLCCPTSQLWKPEVLGGIYRVRRADVTPIADPRGRQIAWSNQSPEQLWNLLGDMRPAVRRRAAREFVRHSKLDKSRDFVNRLDARASRGDASWMTTASDPFSSNARTAALARLWALSPIDSPESRQLIRRLLSHPDASVRHAAMHSVSVNGDRAAAPLLCDLLSSDTAANRRAAAEALGRVGDAAAVPHLLSAAAAAEDRSLQHSITYALIELADPAATRAGLTSSAPPTVAATLVALDQMPGGGIAPPQVVPLLNSSSRALRRTARWIVLQHPEWGGELAQWIRAQLAALPERAQAESQPAATASEFESMLVLFASHPDIQRLMAEILHQSASLTMAREMILRAMASAKLAEPPSTWRDAVAKVIADSRPSLLPLAIAAARAFPAATSASDLERVLTSVAISAEQPKQLRVAALAAVKGPLTNLSDPLVELLHDGLATENSPSHRAAAADALSRATLSPTQLDRLCDTIARAGPLEINRLIEPFAHSADEKLGRKLLASLKGASALPAVRVEIVRESLAGCGPILAPGIDELEALVSVDAAAQRARINDLLPDMKNGDVHRGHAVFYSAKAACSGCHRLAYAGGTVGPELGHIGKTRTERDLLESILYPSLSFVRSYEPVVVTTVDGRVLNGVAIDESDQELLLAIGADESVRLARSEVDQIEPSAVSIMPAGLDTQLSTQELADLVAFLKDTTRE